MMTEELYRAEWDYAEAKRTAALSLSTWRADRTDGDAYQRWLDGEAVAHTAMERCDALRGHNGADCALSRALVKVGEGVYAFPS